MSQLDCQHHCEQNFGWVEISYSHMDRVCYTCKDSILSTDNIGNGFYITPGDKQEAIYYQKCNTNDIVPSFHSKVNQFLLFYKERGMRSNRGARWFYQ